MNRLTSITLLALPIGLLAAAAVAAQTPATPAPQALTYEMAVQVIDAAEAEARKNKWNVTIVVTDAAGVPVVLRRLTGASPRSYDIATRKAATVVASKLATSAYGEQLKAGTRQGSTQRHHLRRRCPDHARHRVHRRSRHERRARQRGRADLEGRRGRNQVAATARWPGRASGQMGARSPTLRDMITPPVHCSIRNRADARCALSLKAGFAAGVAQGGRARSPGPCP